MASTRISFGQISGPTRSSFLRISSLDLGDDQTKEVVPLAEEETRLIRTQSTLGLADAPMTRERICQWEGKIGRNQVGSRIELTISGITR